PSQALREVLALEELHDDVRAPARVDVAVQDLDDPRVADRRGRPRLREEAGDHVLVLRQLGQQHLDGRVPPDVAVAPEVDLTHPPGAEAPDDVVRTNLRANL